MFFFTVLEVQTEIISNASQKKKYILRIYNLGKNAGICEIDSRQKISVLLLEEVMRW